MAEIERYVCGLKREFGYLQPYMSPAERGRWVKYEDHALIAGDLRIELQLAEDARERAESRCEGLEAAISDTLCDDEACSRCRFLRTALEQDKQETK